MVEFNVVNFITVGLIVVFAIMLLRWVFQMAGKTAPI